MDQSKMAASTNACNILEVCTKWDTRTEDCMPDVYVLRGQINQLA
jgi:hypothetical protein